MAIQSRSSVREKHIKRPPRIEGRHSATLVTADGNNIPVTVTNLSGGGFRVESDELLRIGEYVALRVSRYGDFPGQIRWALGTEAGGVFLVPVVLPTELTSN
ncbi:MAG: PilZ domain-containing protein [Sphingomonas bacterium]|nr:PilZ domain-containing protein [Sphingomonas bacterium]